MYSKVKNEYTAALFDASRNQEKDFGVWRKLAGIRFCARNCLTSVHSVRLRLSDYLFNLKECLIWILFCSAVYLFIYLFTFIRIAAYHHWN